MSRVKRPTALELSFGETRPKTPPPSGPSTDVPQKRKRELSPLRKRLPPDVSPIGVYLVDRHELSLHDIYNEQELDVYGEDPEARGEDEHRNKPVRSLNDFALYDKAHQNEYMFISALDMDKSGRRFALGGLVAPFAEPEDEALEEDQTEAPEQYVVLENDDIIAYDLDMSCRDGPTYIETKIAWYLLQTPSKSYQPFWRHFLLPRRIAQICIAEATENPRLTTERFLGKFLELPDPFGRDFVKDDLDYEDVIQELHHAVQELPNAQNVRSVPFIRELLAKTTPPRARVRNRRANPLPEKFMATFRNPDTALLRPENQQPTQVTPRIGELAKGLVPENIHILGAKPKDSGPTRKQVQDTRNRLKDLVSRARRIIHGPSNPTIDHRKEDRLTRNSDFTKKVTIDRKEYQIGDVVLMATGFDQEENKEPVDLPHPEDQALRDKHISEFFWFAKIVNINYNTKQAHVQWYQHSTRTVMGDCGDKQELFLLDHCDNIHLGIIVEKVVVHHVGSADNEHHQTPFGEFFCKMMYDRSTAQFTSFTTYPENPGPSNRYCSVCALKAERDTPYSVVVENNIHVGFSVRDQEVRLFDFILYHNGDGNRDTKTSGPGHIGQIYEVNSPRGASEGFVKVKRVGRIGDLKDVLPLGELADERHVFMTNEVEKVLVQDIIQAVYIFHPESIPQPLHLNLDEWIDLSPDHFYVRYRFPTLNVTSWNSKEDLQPQQVLVCAKSVEKKLRWMEDLATYNAERKLKAIDLFGGAGAFGVGMAAAHKSFEVKYAIELTPSAARTYRKNSRGTQVCNQCVNAVLRYIVKKDAGHDVGLPKQLFDGETDIPKPPGKKDVDVIVAGLPCQPHSDLNMFKKADDRKSNLILTMLSYVDFYQPSYVFIENVSGFLRFNLGATQRDRYTTEGGITQGGLKLLTQALTEMNYQLRFARLQAGHYGTPQDRIRFILVAAKLGKPLPQLPQPTHEFENPDRLLMRLADERVTRPILTERGRALHGMVSIEDACHDLARWDWHPPNIRRLIPQKQEEFRNRKRDLRIPAERCEAKKAYCGTKGPMNYFHAPKTRYQKQARAHHSLDLQHYTKTVSDPKVQRTWGVPLIAGADFKCE
ncbi:hypothetical protein PQX77_002546 [Marasmius sp. AFHP31]|nr:hypothetical protein PQX77_002546 [Marasmius sp. AFHP31]